MGGKNISKNNEPETEEGTIIVPADPIIAGEETFESCKVKGVIFDCYQTLIDIHTEEHRVETYETVSAWLAYHGVKIKPEKLWDTYMFKVEERMDESQEIYPEVRVEEIFAEICRENSIWKIDEKIMGIETSRVFRAASIRKLRPFPQSIKLIEHCINIPKCIISNGQRVFSELELRFLGIYDYFDFVIFSSDVGYKKPDLRLFMTALKRMELELEPRCVMSLGDSYENEILPARKLGMRAMTIEEAWKHYGITD
ncbi:TPA: HAD family hydrolase [Methanosarcina acetivorans]|uniref:Haloacid dehalogenase-like hydrolase n=2 Tax=Methanosarcina acetivorans TaxID=2214 RepID=Q8TLJ3_METAC|nr:HAD family hydrolase [Methanosarcina acetivorans]AAM06416.1 haloacid dehalogenase-like hydrolase [Methanosarcina acetivorans C2A]HIH94983.1 HAD family hydrolase [Methanosarcina acetivorans]